MTLETPASRTLVEAQGRKTERAAYEDAQMRSFHRQLTSSAANPNQLMEALHLNKFTEEMARQTLDAERARDQAREAERLAKASFREDLLASMTQK